MWSFNGLATVIVNDRTFEGENFCELLGSPIVKLEFAETPWKFFVYSSVLCKSPAKFLQKLYMLLL